MVSSKCILPLITRLFSTSNEYEVTLYEGFASNGLDAYAYVVDPHHHVFQNTEPLFIGTHFYLFVSLFFFFSQ
jgi:hypothetical protein